MNNLDKRDPKNWTQEEKDRVVGVFQLLLEMDKKQHPERYRKPPTHEKGRSGVVKVL